jgi:hypothetical protein
MTLLCTQTRVTTPKTTLSGIAVTAAAAAASATVALRLATTPRQPPRLRGLLFIPRGSEQKGEIGKRSRRIFPLLGKTLQEKFHLDWPRLEIDRRSLGNNATSVGDNLACFFP